MATTAEKAAELRKLGVSEAEINKAITQSNLQKSGVSSNTQTISPAKTSQPTTNGTQAYQQAVKQDTNTYTYDQKTGTYNTGAGQKKQVADYWNSLSQADQQKAIDNKPELKSYLSNQGLTQKRADVDTSTSTQFNVQTREAGTQPTKTESQRDYQSQDDTRMQEIVNNLDYYKVNEPYLFNNYETYRDAFLTGKGRSPEQEALINQYYFGQKQMQEYGLMSANDLAMGLVNGTIDAGYFSYLQMSDPSKAQEVSSAMQSINNNYDNQAYYDSIKGANGFGDGESTGQSKFLQVMKNNGLLVDNNNNIVDDRLDIVDYPGYEEYQGHLSRLNELNGQLEDLNDMKRKILDDLIESHPGVSLSTLNVIAADRSSDIDDQIYELNKLIRREQGDISIYQEEFNLRQTAAQDTINMLQKDYGMYYQYTPEGLSELAQAQYAATNITLDQADTGTYTQKQMALESVLAPIYEQYGSIIQRPQAQVINDVIAYAQKNGVSLSQALETNFMTPLKSEPAYQQIQASLASGGTTTAKDLIQIGDKYYRYNESTNQLEETTVSGGGKSTTEYGASYTPVPQYKLDEALQNFQQKYPDGSVVRGGECGMLVNDLSTAMGSDIHVGDSLASKTKYINVGDGEQPKKGDYIVFDWTNYPGASDKMQYAGHIGVYMGTTSDGGIIVYNQNGLNKGKVSTDVFPASYSQYIAGYIDPTKSVGGQSENADYLFQAKVLSWIPTQLRNTDVEKQWYLDIVDEMKRSGINDSFEAAMKIIGFDVTNNSAEGQALKDKVLNVITTQGSSTVFDAQVLAGIARNINNLDYNAALDALEKQVAIFANKNGWSSITGPQMITLEEEMAKLGNLKAKGGISGATTKVKDWVGFRSADTAQFNSEMSNLGQLLVDMGYKEDYVDGMLPTLLDSKSTYNQKLDTITAAVLTKFNGWRKYAGLEPMTADVLLGNKDLKSLYKLSPEQSLINSIN